MPNQVIVCTQGHTNPTASATCGVCGEAMPARQPEVAEEVFDAGAEGAAISSPDSWLGASTNHPVVRAHHAMWIVVGVVVGFAVLFLGFHVMRSDPVDNRSYEQVAIDVLREECGIAEGEPYTLFSQERQEGVNGGLIWRRFTFDFEGIGFGQILVYNPNMASGDARAGVHVCP